MHPNSTLHVKLRPPSAQQPLLARQHLLDRLHAAGAAGGRLIYLIAPAGYGKSSLAAAWLRQSATPGAWLSLGASDNDPICCLQALLSALQLVYPTLGQSLAGVLTMPGCRADAWLDSLLAELPQAPAASKLVLDDLHAITNPVVQQLLLRLTSQLPSQVKLLIASREDPPWPSARLRVSGELLELRARDLRFTSAEIGRFVELNLTQPFAPAVLHLLEQKTEGWPAGLQLTALTLRGRDQQRTADFIAALAGTNRYIADYLLQEVLQSTDPDLQEFLRQTAALPRLSARLCDHVTGRQDSDQLLLQLQQRGLFLLALDDNQCWFRYHHLFAQLLQTGLHWTEVADTQRRAAVWFERQSLLPEAVELALAAADRPLAVRLITVAAVDVLKNGELITLLRWLQRLPAGEPDAALAVYQSWALFLTGEVAAASHCLAQLPTADLSQRSEGLLHALQALFVISRDREQAIRLSKRAVQLLASDDDFFLATALLSLAQALAAGGDYEQAAAEFARAAQLARQSGNHFLTVAAWLNQILNLNWLGQRRQALLVCQTAWRHYSQTPQIGASQLSELIRIGQGLLAYEGGELAAACEHLSRAGELCRQLSLVQMIGTGEWFLLHSLLASGQLAAAGRLVTAMGELAARTGLPAVQQLTRLLQAELLIAQGDAGRCDWLEDLDLTGQPLGQFQFMQLLCRLRYLAALRRWGECQLMLGRLRTVIPDHHRWQRLQLSVWAARVSSELGDQATAERELTQAIDQAAPDGYRQVFSEHLAQLVPLLPAVRSSSPEFAASLVATARSAGPRRANLPVEELSQREQEILQLVAGGHSNEEIAALLFISVGTAKWHLNNIYSKLGVKRRTQAVEIARQRGLLT